MLDIVVLAAGRGTRMQSAVPKVLHTIGGQSLLGHVLASARELQPEVYPDKRFHIVVGYGSDRVSDEFAGQADLHFVKQQRQLGTGHAVQQVLPYLRENASVLILYGDVPLITTGTLERLLETIDDNSLGLLTVDLDDPTGYGRILRDDHGAVLANVEQKDATADELAISEVNTGIMAVNSALLRQWLPLLNNDNAQGEYYLTDSIAMAVADGIPVKTSQPDFTWEVMGVNNRRQQAELERIYQYHRAGQLMDAGVTLYDPHRFDCRGDIRCGTDVTIDVNCVFEGDNTIGNQVTIEPNCRLNNAVVGDGAVIHANSIVEGATVGAHCHIGPFARLRPGTTLADNAKIGNFVETKQAAIGKGSKVNHLSYIGDTVLGDKVNIGAGTITCNYDGVNKHQTTIGDDVFVGSNCALIAPVTIEQGATIGAGSTINKDVAAQTLAVARALQKNRKDWRKPVKNP